MTKDSVEVDLVIERPGEKTIFIEIKSTNQINSIRNENLRGFEQIVADNRISFKSGPCRANGRKYSVFTVVKCDRNVV